MLHAVVMAGGSGTRFWPASRRETPKQLLRMVGERTMIQSTIDRLQGLVPAERNWVITNRALEESIAEQLPELAREHILGEPCKRDTAPCVGLAAAILAAQDPDAVMLCLPADHVIGTVPQFQAAIRAGLAHLEAVPEQLITFGIRPTYPAQSFGYIERGETIPAQPEGVPAFQVKQFREKPDAVTAAAYVAAGDFYWNSGIFLWRADTILKLLGLYEPEMASHLARIREAVGSARFTEVLETEFTAIRGKSIDYAVMERYKKIVVLEAPFSWDDLGSWQALARLQAPDENRNTVQGNHIGIDTKGCIVRTEGEHTVVTIGVDDLVIVHTPKATLVVPKHQEERVREAVKRLEELGLTDLI